MAGKQFDDIDRYININEAKNLFDGSDFKSEKELCDYIELNIELFAFDCLGVKLKSYIRECPVQVAHKRKIRGQRRIDFLIEAETGEKIGVECKHPTFAHSELSAAIGQALSYFSLFKSYGREINRIAIVSSKADYIIAQVAKDFNLPLEYICINKRQSIIMNRELLQEN